MEFNHIPVLLNESIDGLNIKTNGIYVDGTLGGAGHSSVILQKLNNTGKLIGIDRDTDALKYAKQKLEKYSNVIYVHDNHDNIKQVLQELEIESVDGILLDLGVSSYQLDEKSRGFSYIQDSKLDMRMDLTQEFSAWDVVNKYSEEDLANIIYQYGEERYSRKIANKICKVRKEHSIDTTLQLAKIIENVVPTNKKDGHPAKRTFQALRIEVNDELKPLYNTIVDCVDVLNSKGRLCVITFHSLEDRTVKKAMQDLAGKCTCPPGLPYCVCGAKSVGQVITRKPIVPGEEECKINPRSKSSKLRIFEKR